MLMTYTTLIDTETVAAHLSDPAFVIIDCRYRLDDEEWGRREYTARHVPGAIYAHLGRDLAGSKTGRNGRHPLPDADALARTFGRFGISDTAQVVAYDQDNGMFGSRLWWLLRWLGHDAVAVLDGGFAKWIAERHRIASGEEARSPRTFMAKPRGEMVVGADEVAARTGDPRSRLVDARAPERFSGDIEPIDPVAGHIPGAVNYFFKKNLGEGDTFHSPDQLRDQLSDVLAGVPPDHVVCYCGSGVTACHNLLALEHAGLRGARLFPGSWSEWSSDPTRPVER